VVLNFLLALRDGLSFVVMPVGSVQGRSDLVTGQEVPVFNLSVRGEEEYFCQGVLVHNCASFIMAVYGFISGWFSTVGGHAGLALPCR